MALPLAAQLESLLITSMMKKYRSSSLFWAALLGGAAVGLSLPVSPASQQETSPPAAASDAQTVNNSALSTESFLNTFISELASYYGDPQVAFQYMNKAALTTPDDAIYQRLFDLTTNAHDSKAALQVTSDWIVALPKSLMALKARLHALENADQLQESVDLLRKHLPTLPIKTREEVLQHWLLQLGVVSDTEQATASAESLIKRYPSAALYATLARLRFIQGSRAAAVRDLQQALLLNPGSQEVAVLAIRHDDADPVALRALVKSYLTKNPKDIDVRLAFAQLLLNRNETQPSLEQTREVLKIDPQRQEAKLLLGALLVKNSHWVEAQNVLQDFLSNADPQAVPQAVATARLLLTEMYQKQGKTQLADLQMQLFGASTHSAPIMLRHAVQLHKAGQGAEALALIDRLPPDETNTRFLVKTQYLRLTKQYQAAFDLYQQAVIAKSDDLDMKYEASLAADYAKRYTEMEQWLQEILAKQPDHRGALNALGYSWADRRIHLEQAKAYIEKAAAQSPRDPAIIDSLGWVYYRQGDLAMARKEIERAYAMSHDPDIAAHLGEIIWQSGDKKLATKIWRRALLNQPDHEVLIETMQRFQVTP